MASLLRGPRPEMVEYARELGLDPSRIRSEGFVIDEIEPSATGRRVFRITYRTEAQRVVVLQTTLVPPGW